MLMRGSLFLLTGKAADAVEVITSGLAAMQSTGATLLIPAYLSHLTIAYAHLRRFDDARRSIGEAMVAIETTKEKWSEAELNRIAGENRVDVA